MGLFDWLSGTDEAKTAADETNKTLSDYGVDITNYYDKYKTDTTGALDTSKTSSLGALGEGSDKALDAYYQGLDTVKDVSTDPLYKGIDAYQSGVDAVKGSNADAYASAKTGIGSWDTLENLGKSYQPLIDTYYSSLGIGDPELAKNTYTTSPGFTTTTKRATDQALAAASAAGQAGSGNFSTRLGEKLYDIGLEDYGAWQDRLSPFVGYQKGAVTDVATGRATGYSKLADLEQKGGSLEADALAALAGGYDKLFQGVDKKATQIADIYGTIGGEATTTAGKESDVYGKYGEDLSDVYGNYVQGLSGAASDIAEGKIQGSRDIAKAGQEDATNWWNLFGSVAKGASEGASKAATSAALASDIRLKRDIIPLGTANGWPLYRFRYRGHDELYVGVMAQDVAPIAPEAVVRGDDGYLGVYYDKLGLQLERWEPWAQRNGLEA